MAHRPETLRYCSNTTPSYHGKPSDTPPVPKVQVKHDLLRYKAELKAQTQHFEKRVEEHLETYEKESRAAKAKLEGDVMRLEREGRELKERVDRLEPTVAHIHRRIVLNDARKKLISSYGYKFKFNVGDSVEKRVQDFLPKVTEKDSALLTAGSLAILFDTSDGSIQAQGNKAAYEATLESKLSAVSLGDDLSIEQRDGMFKLLRFAYDV